MEQSALTASSVSQCRAGSPAPLKCPMSLRTARDRSTLLVVMPLFRSSTESYNSWMMYLALCAKAPGSLVETW